MRKLSICLCGIAAFVAVAAPATAPAQERCLFQGLKASSATTVKVERSLLCLTNVHRANNGLGALLRDTRLGSAARAHSSDMVSRDYFDHFTPEGASPSDRARAAGYPGGAGENIAANSTGSAFSLLDQWRNSSGHNQNMLGSSYLTAGFGVAPGTPGRAGSGVTGTQMFGSAAADGDDTALDLYASSGRCAKAKKRKLKAKGEKRRAAKRQVKRRCKPLARASVRRASS